MEALVGKLMMQNGRCLPIYNCSSWLDNHLQHKRSCSLVSFRRASARKESISSSLYSSSDYLLRPVSAVLSSAMAPLEAEYGNGISSPSLADTDLSKSVHVKFVLQKNCLFGQHFALVGNHPILGLWDPTKAIPLEWSEDHIWTVKMELPVDEIMQFKFILRGLSSQIHWQPGPDRILQTWETTKTIVVVEEWDNAANQKIIEEDESAIRVEESPVTEGKNEGIVLSHDTSISNTQGSIDAASQNESNLADEEGDFLLVPGLKLTSASESAVDIQNVASLDVNIGSDSAEDHNLVQLLKKEEQNVEATEKLLEEEVKSIQVKGDCSEESHDCVQEAENFKPREENSKTTSNILKKDFQWGRKFVENLLYSMGFNASSTEAS